MRSAGQLLAGVAVGVAVTIGVGTLWGFRSAEVVAPIGAEPPAEAVRTTPDAGAAGRAGVSAQLARIEATLAELGTAIEALRQRVDSLATSSGARTPIVTPASVPPAVIDEDSIVRALERVEEKKLEGMSVGELLLQSNQLLEGGDPAAARRAVEAALERAPEPRDRARVLTQLGVVHRSLGDLESSARVLEGAVAEFGADSPEGASAAYQLVWTRCKAGDNDRALQLADTIAGSTRVDESMRVNARWAAAIVAESAGDAARARAGFEALLREYGGRPEFLKLTEDVRRRLGRSK